MSLIAATREVESLLDNLKRQAEQQQRAYFNVITGMVHMHQKHRVAGNYLVSDEIRALLNMAMVSVDIQPPGRDGALAHVPIGVKPLAGV
jgi:cysteinyl-tRNA synthetase